MDDTYFSEVAGQVLARTDGVEHTEWSDADKVRMVGLVFHRFMLDPETATPTATEWAAVGSNVVELDILKIADRLEELDATR